MRSRGVCREHGSNARHVCFVEEKFILNIEMEAKGQMLEGNVSDALGDIRNGGRIDSRCSFDG